jgi:hypothetical protein
MNSYACTDSDMSPGCIEIRQKQNGLHFMCIKSQWQHRTNIVWIKNWIKEKTFNFFGLFVIAHCVLSGQFQPYGTQITELRKLKQYVKRERTQRIAFKPLAEPVWSFSSGTPWNMPNFPISWDQTCTHVCQMTHINFASFLPWQTT